MSLTFQAIVRDFQTRVKGAVDGKAWLQRYVRKNLRRPFEAEYEILKYVRNDGGDFVDVGANRGQSIDAIRLYHTNAKIQAFEPNALFYSRLLPQYANDSRISVQNYGLGATEEEQTLFVPSYRGYTFDGLASFNRTKAQDWLNKDTVWRFDLGLLTIRDITCHIRTLDSFGLQPTFLKLHTQGFEYNCLVGGEKTITQYKPVTLMANHEAGDDWLRSRGWSQFAYSRRGLVLLPANDPHLYNVIYLHPQNEAHQTLIENLGVT